MKIKLDEHLPASLVDILQRLGHDTDTVPFEGLAGTLFRRGNRLEDPCAAALIF